MTAVATMALHHPVETTQTRASICCSSSARQNHEGTLSEGLMIRRTFPDRGLPARVEKKSRFRLWDSFRMRRHPGLTGSATSAGPPAADEIAAHIPSADCGALWVPSAGASPVWPAAPVLPVPGRRIGALPHGYVAIWTTWAVWLDGCLYSRINHRCLPEYRGGSTIQRIHQQVARYRREDIRCDGRTHRR